MEMPCPCQQCGEIFDLHDGTASEKWYPNTIICGFCGEDESKEIETDNELDEINERLLDAYYTIGENTEEKIRLLKKRKEMGIVEEPVFEKPEPLKLIVNEIFRVRVEEGFSEEHDDQWEGEELAVAGSVYAYPENRAYPGREIEWPENWDLEWYKPDPHNRLGELAKAAQLIHAEMVRLVRLKSK